MLLLYLGVLDTSEQKSKFEQLYYQYRKLMLVCAKDILKDEHLAEDAVHDAFMKLMNHLGKIDEVTCNKTKRFVVIVVECAAKDIWRREKRHSSISWETIENEWHFSLEAGAELSPTEEAIRRLPLSYRQIFELKYGWGYSNKEIAAVLCMKEGTVRQRVARGKVLLQEILTEMEVYIGGTEYRNR